MNNPQTTCDPRRIEACLSESLGDEEQAAFEAHLEMCAACRQALEASAAAPAEWQSVRTFLSSDASIECTEAQGPSGRWCPQPLGLSAARASHAPSDGSESSGAESVDGVLSALGPTDNPHMLGRLGAYEVAGVVGRGGMGVVLKALDPALNRFVAIKVLAPQLATSGAARQRFAREARAAASVVHENVVAIHAVADGGVLPYFVMPYLRGASLQKRLDAHGPLGVPEILRVAMQIAAGLSAAHAQGLVHRDIKPANILLEDGVERLKITDFGLARAADDASLTRTGVIAGTPQFMSPEQARGELVDHRSDLFSLGSLMYTMCTGRPPFRSETSYGTLQKICDAQPRAVREINPDIPEWLAALVDHLLAKNPVDRFQTAQEVAQLLEQCLAHLRQPDVVPLPAAVTELVIEKTKSLAPQLRRVGWPFFCRTPGQLRRAAFKTTTRKNFVLVAIFALAAIPIAAFMWPSGQQEAGVRGQGSVPHDSIASPAPFSRDPQGSELQAAGIRSQEEPTSPTDQPTLPSWDDELTLRIRMLQADIYQLEERISALESPSLPLPLGEGWGEGEAIKKPSKPQLSNQEENR